MIKVLIGYWLAVNALNVVGGTLGWLEFYRESKRLEGKKKRVATWQGRILMAEALRSGITIIGIQKFEQGLSTMPYYIGASVVIVTLLCGAIWGWLLFLRGTINGE